VAKGYLLDTNVLVDHLRHHPMVNQFMKTLDEEEKHYSIVTEIEVYAGAREAELPETDLLLSAISRLSLDEPVAKEAVRYLKLYAKSHGTDLPDAVIAATAHVHQLILVTWNIKHFPMSDIKVQSPV